MSENAATHNDHHILPILAEHFSDPASIKFRSFKINLDDVDRAMVMVASTSLPISPIPRTHVIQADNDANLTLSFYGVVELKNRADILRRACDVLPLSNTEFLSIYFPSSNLFINWSEIFPHSVEVTTVQVYGRGTTALLQALEPPKRANSTASGKRRKSKRDENGGGTQTQAPNENDNPGLALVDVPCFPKLMSLLLECLDFSYVPGSSVPYDLLLSAVQWRKTNNMPLTRIRIDHCVISEKQSKALEKVVGDFRWDHDEGYYDSNDGFGGWGDDIPVTDVRYLALLNFMHFLLLTST
jgi:hypothetical protein